jgi:hypothetical protein
VNEPTTKAGCWLLDRANWNDGMRGFFVRINATAGPEDMLRHIIAIEQEARAAGLAEVYGYHDIHLRDLRAKVVELEDPRHEPPWFDDDHIVRSDVLDLVDRAIRG